MLKKRLLLLGCLVWLSTAGWAKKPSVDRIDPPFWWVEMEMSTIELLIKGEELGSITEVTCEEEGLTVKKLDHFSNPNYISVTLEIGRAVKPGTYTLNLVQDKKKFPLEYTLRPRNVNPDEIPGLTSADFIYLIFPDRFSNGDPGNDKVSGMNQTTVERDSSLERHGGDLQGIIDHMDYIRNLGVTALWINPVQENDQPFESYHGYAITDHYLVDPRFGTNELYRDLVKEGEKKKLKTIMDVVYNHWGDQHYLQLDPPDKDWVHQWKEFTKTSYRAPTLLDPYGAESDKELFVNGWFDHHMPDINQQNPHVANYLIQNSIWWIEFSGIHGFRIDTYAYSDIDFMVDLVDAVLVEYPKFGIFGETWVHGAPVQAFFSENRDIHPDHRSNLPGVTDFQLYYAINDALTKKQGWTDGVAKMYYTLAKDYLYTNPTKNVLFLDNHDLSRFSSVIGADIAKYKLGVAWLMTMRGIPMMYYGTEILMQGFADDHGKIREDFPGGFPGDKFNKFDGSSRTRTENEAFNFVKTLANYRRNNEVLQTGKLTQFIPQDGLYVYFRYNDKKTVMVAMNCSEEENVLEVDRFHERLWAFTSGKDVMSGEKVMLTEDPTLEPFSVMVVEFEKD